MFRPLSDDEKREALRDGAIGTIREAQRRSPELQRLAHTAQNVFQALLQADTWTVEEAELPPWMKTPPVEELWSVKAEVTND
jgi:hypothetical protein